LFRELEGKVRRVIRLTLVNVEKGDGKFGKLTNMKDEHVKEYVSLIEKSRPDFIHAKGFKSVGYARERLEYNKMPWFDEIKEFAKKLESSLEDYEIKGEHEPSSVVMLAKKGVEIRISKV